MNCNIEYAKKSTFRFWVKGYNFTYMILCAGSVF